jgi:hypothetical protein
MTLSVEPVKRKESLPILASLHRYANLVNVDASQAKYRTRSPMAKRRVTSEKRVNK